MADEVSTIQKIKAIILDIDPMDVIQDAQACGMDVEYLEDFAEQAHDYACIARLAAQYSDVAARYCALSGVGSGIGGIATTLALAGADISNMAAQLYRLNQKVALLHGFDPDNEMHQEQVVEIYCMALGVDAASSAAIYAMARKAGWESIAPSDPASSMGLSVTMAAAKAVGIAMGKRTAAKAVPLLGAVLGGGVNYWFAQQAAKKMVLAYQSHYFDRWQLHSCADQA